MGFVSRSARWLLLASVLPAALAWAGSYEVLAPDAEAGGGALAGGAYTAFGTIAATGPAAVLGGGTFEATGGLERRRDAALPDAVFADGFED